MRTLPYLKAWHERYGPAGLRVVGVHCPGFDASREEQAVRDAVERLEIGYPVLIDSEFELWQEYENQGWPARYLFDGRGRLFDYHYGEGAYEETELAVQELLGLELDPIEPLRPEDARGGEPLVQTANQPGAYCGPYEAGGVWAARGLGQRTVNGGPAAGGSELRYPSSGAYPLRGAWGHTSAVLELDPGAGTQLPGHLLHTGRPPRDAPDR